MSKREAILKAATELFAQKGYHGTAVSEIAERADVAQGTVFHHFKSKENLLVSICDELVNTYIEGINTAAEGPGTGWEALERVLKFNQEFRGCRYDSIAVVFRETRDLSRAAGEVHEHFGGLVNQIIDVKSRCIEKGIADGSIRSVSPRSTALLIHLFLVGEFHVETEGLLEIPDMEKDLIEFCKRSLVPESQGGSETVERCGG
jgi:AcrR family transcriptional regulator